MRGVRGGRGAGGLKRGCGVGCGVWKMVVEDAWASGGWSAGAWDPGPA